MPKKVKKSPKKKSPELKENEEYRLDRAPIKKDEAKKEPYIRLNLQPKMKDDITKIIMDEVTNADSNEERKKFIKHCDYCRKRYTMEDLDTDWPWENASQRRTGGTTIATDRLKPRMKKALFYSGHIMDITPGEENTEENAEQQEEWMDSTMRYDMKVEEVVGDNVLYDGIVLNFGVVKNAWVDDREVKEEITIYESVDELLRNYPDAMERYPQHVLKLTGYDTIDNLTYDFPGILEGDYSTFPVMVDAKGNKIKVGLREKFRDGYIGLKPEWVDPKDIIFPKGVVEDGKSWIVIQHLKMRRDELMRKKENNFFENVDDMFKEESGDDAVKDYGKEYDIYEAILRYDIDRDDLEEKCVYWIGKSDAGTNIYLRGVRFPFTHGENYIIIFRTDNHRYGFYTGGLGAKLKSVNMSEDRRVNQISNAWDQAIVKAWHHIKTPGSPYNPRVHKYYPAAVIPVGSKDELTEASTSDIPASSITLLEDNRRENELLVGFTMTATSGQEAPRDPNAPAKKTQLLLAEGSISIGEYLKNFVNSGMKKLAYQTQMDYYQLTDTTEVNYRADRGFETISKQKMRAKAMFTCRTALESVAAEDKARANLALMQATAEHPLAATNYQFQWYLLKSIVQNWSEDLARNIDKLMSNKIRDLLIQQQEQAQALAQEKAQEEERMKQIKAYAQRRKMEGVPKEFVDAEVAEIMTEGQGQGEQR